MHMDDEGWLAGFAAIIALLIIWVIALTCWNGSLMNQIEELKLRHEQLEEGFADFLDEYYQVETIWPEEFQFIGKSGSAKERNR